MPRLRVDQYLAVIVFSMVLMTPVAIAVPLQQLSTPVNLKAVAPIPVAVADELSDEELLATVSARSIAVIDVESASILLQRHAHEPISPASTTKLMTALVARENYDLDQIMTVSSGSASVGHVIGFPVGSQFTVKELLKALLISSGNDAANILAQHHPQGYIQFVTEMNQQAQALNLTQTSFTNPAGLDAFDHQTTAFELSLLAREFMKDDFFSTIVDEEESIITDVSGRIVFNLYNTNQLIGRSDVVGIKTGTTDLAGEALITQVERDGKAIIIVLLGSQNRYVDTEQIMEWVFRQYRWENFSVS